jgi:hypothetical protein
MTLISCAFSKHCKWANIPHAQANGFFQPQNVGENCHHYEMAPVEIDMHKQVMAAMSQRGFLTLGTAPWLIAAVCAVTAVLFFNLYQGKVDEFANYKSAVESAQEQVRLENERKVADLVAVNTRLDAGWSDALDDLRSVSAIRVRKPNCSTGALPDVPAAPSEPDAATAEREIGAEQCEAIANNAVTDAAHVMWLQHFINEQHKATK